MRQPPEIARALLALALAFALGCSPTGGSPTNVLVICIDVLRADHLGTYGYARDTSPSLDALARSGVVFESASSPASWTKPSVPSYFTGRFPHQHGVYEGSREVDGQLVSDVLPEEELTLAELFQSAGFQTVGLIKNRQLGAHFGFDQGFDLYREFSGDASAIRAGFEEWLGTADAKRPFFAYLHFLDVHLPYDPPDAYRDRFGSGVAPVDFSVGSPKLLKQQIRDGVIQLSDADRQALTDLYDGEIAFTDAQIGEVLALLRKTGQLDDTLVVILSDHGEELLERGGIGHGSSLYQELIHVPLILRFPDDAHGGTRVAEPVGLVDVVPTLAEYFELDLPDQIAGQSLLALATGRDPGTQRAIYAEGLHGDRYQQAVRVGHWKYIATVRVPDAEEVESESLRELLREGVRVEVEGLWDGERFSASEVEIYENTRDERHEATGPIEAIGADGFRVLGFDVEFEEDAEFLDWDENPIAFSSLEPGQLVKIYGRASDGVFEAKKLKLRDPKKRNKRKLEGRVSGLTQGTMGSARFEVAGRLVVIDRKTGFERAGASKATREFQPSRGRRDPWLEAREAGRKVHEELYDLSLDPGERSDVASANPRKIVEMRALLKTLREKGTRSVPTRASANARALDDEDVEALRNLGYVE